MMASKVGVNFAVKDKSATFSNKTNLGFLTAIIVKMYTMIVPRLSAAPSLRPCLENIWQGKPAA